jgi:uncharacterized protein (DUF2252 family)
MLATATSRWESVLVSVTETTETAPEAKGREAGKAARKAAPRSGQGHWEPGPDRVGPLEILSEQDRTRVPQLVPVRYGRMLASPFTFYRGAAAIMANDLASAPDSGLRVQLCGDAHLSNFGVFQAPDRRLVFDINDFDETLPGPFEWDVKRLVGSVAIAARDRGFDAATEEAVALAGAAAYREAMAQFAAMKEIDVWYARLDMEEFGQKWSSRVSKAARRRADKNLEKARGKDSLRALAKLTERRGGEMRIASRPPLLVPIGELAEREGLEPTAVTAMIHRLLREYAETLDDQARLLIDRYRYVDAAHKVVGVGSVGTRAWIALLFGRDEQDPLFLQMKEAGPSVLEPFAGASRFEHHGRRVVAGQRLMQAAGDGLLGWISTEGIDGKKRDFYVRQLWDGKGSAEVELMSATTMAGYAQLCGWTLARAHARTGDRQAISAYIGKGDRFDRAIAEFSLAYADQNDADYAVLTEAQRTGDLEVATGL